MQHHQTTPLPSFVAESTVAKLAKWLRLAGFDVVLDHGIPQTHRLLQMAEDGRRMVLTRTRRVFNFIGPDRCIFIRPDRIDDQLRVVMNITGVGYGDLSPLTRCAICNRELLTADKTGLRGRVPEHVWHHHEKFLQCPLCDRIYWPGTHAATMRKSMQRWFTAK